MPYYFNSLQEEYRSRMVKAVPCFDLYCSGLCVEIIQGFDAHLEIGEQETLDIILDIFHNKLSNYAKNFYVFQYQTISLHIKSLNTSCIF